ncbi:type II secretion system F family protein [uncultured Dialister sp.]|uniref:type II secretion system F family protein n=1 Tax=uncultured Dialister sp. TaxID=278064 RepID=UPI0025852CFC|nr:type II secretion system F family protein [uncultured Dialister sp.]
MILLISLLFAFLFFLLLFLGLQVLLRRKREMAERIQMFSGYQPSVVRRASVFEILRSRLHEIFAEKARRTGSASRRSRLDLMMVRAGLPLLGSEFLAISAGLSLFVFIIFALATFNPVTGLLAAFLFLAADFVFVQRRITKRLNNFQRQLADCLSLVANSLRAGFSFLQTMEIISREMEPPMSTEFERVMRDTSLGKSLDEALHDMDERVGSADFSLVVTAVLIQQQVGGNLATILDTIRSTITERIRIRREVNTLTAQGKMSGIVLACIPVALALFFYISSPEYLTPLLTTDIGKVAIIGTVFLVIVGFIIIRKIVDIKV